MEGVGAGHARRPQRPGPVLVIGAVAVSGGRDNEVNLARLESAQIALQGDPYGHGIVFVDRSVEVVF